MIKRTQREHRSCTRHLLGLVLAAAVIMLPALSSAQDEKAEGAKKEGEGDTPKVKVERGAGGKKVYVIKTGFIIEGRIQKPNAFYVLQRSQINYDWAALKQLFVPRILDSLSKSPF